MRGSVQKVTMKGKNASSIQLIGDKVSYSPSPVPGDEPHRVVNLPPRYKIKPRDFAGRHEILKVIESALMEDGSQLVVCGMGAMGKSRLACEYAHRNKKMYPLAIWWINAESPHKACRELLIRFGELTKDDDDIENVQRALKSWYDKNEKGGWLLIFDNADSYNALFPYLPHNLVEGRIFITTCKQHEFSNINTIPIAEFSIEEATECLMVSSGIRCDDASAREIAAQLERVPLALAQAASYIVENDCTFAEYIELLKEDKRRLLEKGKPKDHPDGVAATWRISLDKLSDAAINLILLCAQLPPNDIPVQLLRNAFLEQNEPELRVVSENTFVWNDVVAELTKLSLVEKRQDKLFMNRLLQDVVKESFVEAYGSSTAMSSIVKQLRSSMA